ncbi:hypothetical protein DPMN_162613 [Dreissena polymorpha]|uniref:Uncharacterized protein n=1 Tax=Dreissena polymorpha TaxID=45954 RepID=A0A9D4EV78_DREPO|nr:hypothetical protein DPMN_162613 [Dreissena polymorpha]
MLRVHQCQVLCVTDRGEDTVHFTQQNPGSQSVWTIDLTYDTFGYYNVSIECFNETRALNKSDNAYIGTAITELDLSSGTDNIFVPVPASKIRNLENVTLNIEFVTGLNVNITVEVLGKTLQGNPQSLTNMTNTTHIITLPYEWFNNNALYPVNVTVSNPFNISINEQVVIALQEEIAIGAISFEGYYVNSKNYILVNQPFNLIIPFTTGQNVSIVANIVAPDCVITSTVFNKSKRLVTQSRNLFSQ